MVTGARPGRRRRTVLANTGPAPEDERSLAGILGLAALLPGWSQPDRVAPSSCAQMLVTTVARQREMVAAWSKVMLSGI